MIRKGAQVSEEDSQCRFGNFQLTVMSYNMAPANGANLQNMAVTSPTKTGTGVQSCNGSDVPPVHSLTEGSARTIKPCAVLFN